LIGVLGERRVHLHQPFGDFAFVVGQLVPVRDAVRPFGELGVGWDDAELLLLCKRALALHVPAVGELTAIAVAP
jgi:hypothetical protein